MRLSVGVEWALHACSLLALTLAGGALRASKLAEFHDIPPAYLAKHLQALARSGIVTPAYGKNGGYRLAKPPKSISLLAIIDAVEGDQRAFRCTEIRRNGPCALPTDRETGPCAFAAAMWAAEEAWRSHLAGVSLADVTSQMMRAIEPGERRLGAEWLRVNAR
jgi:Rrf2 family protein